MTFVQATHQAFCTQTTVERHELAVAFNAGVHAYDGWEPALRVLIDLNNPVVITVTNLLHDYVSCQLVFAVRSCLNWPHGVN